MIRKSFTVLPGTTKVLDAERGIVEGWVNSTAVVDAQKDVMEPGCWADVTKAATDGKVAHPSTVWGHDWNITTGKVVNATEHQPGDPAIPEEIRALGAGSIKIVAHYNLDTQRGREAFSDVKFGAIRQWSVGFIADPDSIRYDSKGVRHIGRVLEWPEVSNVLMGASPGTMTASVKSADGQDRKARTADRLARAKAMVEALKAGHSHYHVHPDGTAHTHGHGHAADVAEHDGPAEKVPHAHGHPAVEDTEPKAQMCCDDCKGQDCTGCCAACCHGAGANPATTAGKSGGGLPGDPPGVPYMEGDEAVHNGPLMQVLDGINTLIAQEIAEGGYTEYQDIIRLCCLAQDAISWAAGEASEYGDFGMYSIWDLFAAGKEALSSKIEPPEEPAEKAAPVTANMPAWLKAAILAYTETGPESTQHPNPALSGEGDGFDKRWTEGFPGFRGLHEWFQQGVVGPAIPKDQPDGDQDGIGPPAKWAERFTSPWRQQQ